MAIRLSNDKELVEEIKQKLKENNGCFDDFVIYTGYYPNEIKHEIEELERSENIIIKFGRFLYNDKPIFDDVLGVTLASSNQYAERIS